MILYSKDELIEKIREIFNRGWHKSVKQTIDRRNDGAVGNTLEALLGIEENNLPIPNAREWELKGQRLQTTSLITLKHCEPSPRATKIVTKILLPYYGWRHKKAGSEYPVTEKSFRSTTSALSYTSRGFKIAIDRKEEKLKIIFNADFADKEDPEIVEWLKSVEKLVGLGPLNPEPYWAFEDLQYSIGSKIGNCFYVIADTKIIDKHEYFKYQSLMLLSGFSFENFLACLDNGSMFIDFDARTGHNHGTKFRIKQGRWSSLYSNVEKVI